MDPGRFKDYLITRIKYVIKIKYVSIDNKVFAMHYRVTATLFLILGALVGITQFFGKPIACIKSVAGDAKVEQAVIENYCWIEGTFILPRAILESIEREEIDGTRNEYAHPGIDTYNEERKGPPDEILETTYYQWVPIVLFFQSLSFFITHLLWKQWEGGTQRTIVNNLFKTIYKKQDILKHQNALIEYLYINRGKNNAYAFRYFICEILNVVHVVIQYAFINWFLGGYYWSYGINVLKGVRPNPMIRVFPTMTKCRFHKFGPSGDVQKYDNLCILPLNILNEKGYLIIWYWLLILGIMSSIAVVYKCLVIGFPASRYYLLHTFNRMVPSKSFYTVLDKVSYGDWFLLYLLSKNLDPFHYRDVVIQLADRLDQDRTGSAKKIRSLLDEAEEGDVIQGAEDEKDNETSI
jgi:hypothetical protein